jgi:hypothetical protein
MTHDVIGQALGRIFNVDNIVGVPFTIIAAQPMKSQPNDRRLVEHYATWRSAAIRPSHALTWFQLARFWAA